MVATWKRAGKRSRSKKRVDFGQESEEKRCRLRIFGGGFDFLMGEEELR